MPTGPLCLNFSSAFTEVPSPFQQLFLVPVPPQSKLCQFRQTKKHESTEKVQQSLSVTSSQPQAWSTTLQPSTSFTLKSAAHSTGGEDTGSRLSGGPSARLLGCSVLTGFADSTARRVPLEHHLKPPRWHVAMPSPQSYKLNWFPWLQQSHGLTKLLFLVCTRVTTLPSCPEQVHLKMQHELDRTAGHTRSQGHWRKKMFIQFTITVPQR